MKKTSKKTAKKSAKKTAKRKTAKKAVNKKPIRKTSRKSVNKKPIKKSTGRKPVAPRRKFSLILKNFGIFLLLFLLSLLGYYASSDSFYVQLYAWAAIIFGILGLAFFIVILVYTFMSLLKK